MKTLTVVLMALVVGLSVLLYLSRRERDQAVGKIEELRENKDLNAVVVDNYLNKDDSTKHQVIRDRIISSTETVYLIDSLKLDSIARALKVKDRQITSLLTMNASLEGSVKASRVTMDSLRNKTYEFATRFLKARFTETDSLLDYKYNAVIGVAGYEQDREGLFGPTYSYINLSSDDPNMTINGLSQFTIKQKHVPNKWGIGVQAGYYFDPETGQFRPAFGVGVSFNVIRF